MPFDGSKRYESDPVIQALRTGQNYIRDPKMWFRGRCTEKDEDRYKRCVLSALPSLEFAAAIIAAELLDEAAIALGTSSKDGEIREAAIYNDTHEHADALALYDKAIGLRIAELEEELAG